MRRFKITHIGNPDDINGKWAVIDTSTGQRLTEHPDSAEARKAADKLERSK